MTRQQQQDDSIPEGQSEPIPPFGSQAEAPSESLSAEMDAIQTLPDGVVNPRDQAQFNAHMLQYIHDSHVRLVRLLKDDRRSEMVVQSSEALNRTFKQLHESQVELARSLQSQRRRHPAIVALGGLMAAAVVLAVAYIVFRDVPGDIGLEVDRLAQARTQQVLANHAALSAQRESAAELLETVNQGFAANRILENENRAGQTELARLRDKLSGLEGRALEAESRQARSEERARESQNRNTELARELSEARQALIERDLRRDQLGDLLESAAARTAAQDLDLEPGNPQESGENSELGRSPQQPEVVHAALTDPVVVGVNRFLQDAGVIDLRLLHSDGVADGALRNAAFEIRSREGFPVGLHEAESVRLIIDATTMSAALILRDGATVVRGVRQRFPDEGLRVAIAAVVPGSWNLEGVSEIVRLEPSEPLSAVAVEPAAETAPAFDTRPLMARLNGALRTEGLEGFQFFRVDGLSDGDLLNVRLHHYGRSGDLRKTVIAARCRIEVDAERRQVRLVFLDGHHVTRGREVPFFRGKGDERGKWSIDLEPDDPSVWLRLQSELLGQGS